MKIPSIPFNMHDSWKFPKLFRQKEHNECSKFKKCAKIQKEKSALNNTIISIQNKVYSQI